MPENNSSGSRGFLRGLLGRNKSPEVQQAELISATKRKVDGIANNLGSNFLYSRHDSPHPGESVRVAETGDFTDARGYHIQIDEGIAPEDMLQTTEVISGLIKASLELKTPLKKTFSDDQYELTVVSGVDTQARDRASRFRHDVVVPVVFEVQERDTKLGETVVATNIVRKGNQAIRYIHIQRGDTLYVLSYHASASESDNINSQRVHTLQKFQVPEDFEFANSGGLPTEESLEDSALLPHERFTPEDVQFLVDLPSFLENAAGDGSLVPVLWAYKSRSYPGVFSLQKLFSNMDMTLQKPKLAEHPYEDADNRRRAETFWRRIKGGELEIGTFSNRHSILNGMEYNFDRLRSAQ